MTDPINKPPHYTHSDIEPLQVIEAWGLGFHLGNVIKYIARHKHKGNERQDLEKAKFYLERELAKTRHYYVPADEMEAAKKLLEKPPQHGEVIEYKGNFPSWYFNKV